MEAKRYRKKPVVIEAVHFFRASDGDLIAAWCGGRVLSEAKSSDPTDLALWVDIPTLEGTMRADFGDYIIRGVKGEFYPCKPDIFETTYERVEE